MKILSKEYIYEHGIDIDDIGYDPLLAIYVIMDTDIPYTGIGYSKYDDDEMESYSFYKNGYEDGEEAKFYPNGKIMSWNNFGSDSKKGESREWYENGILMRMGKFDGNVCLEYNIWDQNGNLIEKMKKPTGDDIRRMKKIVKEINQ